ncbi:carboxymuconolactone decarboxylase family protein [Desulforhopalus vacuolatus]|uniref:carboxymuconolactone decarboxylase family protein n=1 Tax=Desulforhopalus vacuolatus TaxID=40414 RepID=UPI001962C135|nr:carboxymuconolactone decarboxylase family protein [Desulforhopalus vacuolatus]MBM9519115.1 carboxymuconolactone decarboxylase family protein [Desulforhopalus vacuolatus]
MYNVREILDGFVNGLGALGETNGETVDAFMGLLGASYKPNAIDLKNKELISVAIGCFTRCEYCIVYHCYKALEAGASREEINEAAMVAVAFGGGPSMAYSGTLLKESLDEFEGEFVKA